jgi:amino acid adenylation domain-containing protein
MTAPVSDRIERLVKAAATRRPGALAVSDPKRTLSYCQLEGHAEDLARTLRSLGVESGDLVGLCVERSAELVVGALGILKAGAAYVALDPKYPQERAAFMLHDAGARVLVGSSATPTALRSQAAFVEVELSHRAPPIAAVETPPSAGENALAYVVYTSGSTGVPKGVMVEHRSVANLVRWHRRAFALTATDRGTQIASPGFDAAVWEIWPYLTTGASLHIPPDEIRADPGALRDWLLAQEITVSFVSTAHAQAVVTVPWPKRAPLRSLLTGGDVLLRSPPPGLPFELVNNYGVTEATVVSTSGVVPPAGGNGTMPSLGRPITGVRVHLVDADLRPVEPGQSGEILLGGISVARGYLNRPDLTEERFVPDHLSGVAGDVLYRTGDLARWRAGDELEFLGRLDDQVTIRGVRIEPGEIAAVLNGHPAVRSSVVLADGTTSNQQLVAYVVPALADLPDAQDLRSHLHRYLPEAMVPTSFVWRDELPLTANDKIDRAALSVDRVVGNSDHPPAPPRTDTEHTVAAIAAELLELDAVGIDEDFFLIGGHSLLAAQLHARLSDFFSVELSLRALFDNPTVAGLADEVERAIVADISSLTDAEAEQLLSELVVDD